MQNLNSAYKHQHCNIQQQQKPSESNKFHEAQPNSLTLTRSSSHPHPAESVTSEENEDDFLQSRYECPICIHWLNEPVLTTCGHRFCRSCLSSWLSNDPCCPVDKKHLTSDDVFPDNFTRREIEQIKYKCPNSPQGCAVVASPIEVDKHLPTCPYRRPQDSVEKCPFASIKCSFIARPETNALEEHLKEDQPHHLQLMLQAFQQTTIASWTAPQKAGNGSGSVASNGLPPPPPQYIVEADEHLVQAMYQRIVVLEQRCREQEAKLENLSKQHLAARKQIDPRYSNGIIVWEVQNFHALIEQLRANANNQVYSHECYTSPYGYKFCARLNIQPKKEHLLSLHVHLMQSENDFHLDWPFRGRIKLCLIHPRDPNLSQHDTIMTKPEILAFHKPRERISTRGFGFIEYANIADLVRKGFCEGDRVVIKIQINIV